jgi:hypothetical protein
MIMPKKNGKEVFHALRKQDADAQILLCYDSGIFPVSPSGQ